MANMSYCRFQSTLADLEDCYDHIDDDDLSAEERQAQTRLIMLCRQIATIFVEYDDRSEDYIQVEDYVEGCKP